MFRHPIVIALVIAILALSLRLPGLGTFMTADEENWMLRSGTFWHALFRYGDPGGTFLTTHPGATTMWLAGAGISWQEQRLGFDIDTSTIKYFRLSATVPIALAISMLVGIVAWQAMRLQGKTIGSVAGALLASEPYFIGMSQVAHLDMLLALFMLNVALAASLFFREQTRRWLVLSGLFTGLALGTKLLPALWLGPFLLLLALTLSSGSWSARTLRTVQSIGFVGALGALVFLLAWPAAWAKNDTSRSFKTDFSNVVTVEHVELQAADDPIAPAGFYLRTLLGRSTPLVLFTALGGAIALSFAAIRYRPRAHVWQSRHFRERWLWVIYSVGFGLLVTMIAKKGDRYLLPALVVLPLLSSWVLVTVYRLLPARFPAVTTRQTRLFLIGVVVLSAALPLFYAPHTIAYNNPWFDVRPLHQQGWGEGLEAAAAWLNAHPLASEMTVATWYPTVLAPYFQGLTTSLSARQDNRVAFVVTYRNMADRGPDDEATAVLAEFRDRPPAHVVALAGKPYAWIYNTIGLHYFPRHVGELTAGMEVGQTVPVATETFDRIEVGLATFSGRHNTGTIQLHVRESLEAREDLRVVTVPAAELEDSAWHAFSFEPIPDSAGKTYYVALSSPNSVPGNAITVKFTEHDLLAGNFFVKGKPRSGDMAYRFSER